MASHEWDAEYGPTPPDAQREHTDIEPSIARNFALWLGVAMIISAGIVYGTFWFFEGREQTTNREAQMFPLAAGRVKEPPGPQLQTQPFKDIYMLRRSEQERLSGYGWIDKGTGTARIPIQDAMRLVVERGLVQSQPAEQRTGVGEVATDSASGRVAGPR
jgi:hypothetical protein